MEFSDAWHVQFKKTSHRDTDGDLITGGSRAHGEENTRDHAAQMHGSLDDLAREGIFDSAQHYVDDLVQAGTLPAGSTPSDLTDEQIDSLHEFAHDNDDVQPDYFGNLPKADPSDREAGMDRFYPPVRRNTGAPKTKAE